MQDVCPWLPDNEITVMGITVNQSLVIITGLVATAVLVVAYRFFTRKRRYTP